MAKVCLYLRLHQPIRLNNYKIYDIGQNDNYFADEKNKNIFINNTQKKYLKMNNLIKKFINKYPNKFKITFSLSGVAIEQMKKYSQELFTSFKEISKTHNVDFLSETYFHSWKFLYSKEEFKKQVNMHKELIEKSFKITPSVFKNTELTFSPDLNEYLKFVNIHNILIKDIQNANFTPNKIYHNSQSNINILMNNKNISQSLDSSILNNINNVRKDGIVNIFLDYNNFSQTKEMDNSETKTFSQFETFVENVIQSSENEFELSTTILKNYKNNSNLIEEIDNETLNNSYKNCKNLILHIQNRLQHSAATEICNLENDIKKSKNEHLIKTWQNLTTSNHLYYMMTEPLQKEQNEYTKYVKTYSNPFDFYIYFMNIINDLKNKLKVEKTCSNPQIIET